MGSHGEMELLRTIHFDPCSVVIANITVLLVCRIVSRSMSVPRQHKNKIIESLQEKLLTVPCYFDCLSPDEGTYVHSCKVYGRGEPLVENRYFDML